MGSHVNVTVDRSLEQRISLTGDRFFLAIRDALAKLAGTGTRRGSSAEIALTATLSKQVRRVAVTSAFRSNDTIPADGEVIEGAVSVNESAVTGESARPSHEREPDFHHRARRAQLRDLFDRIAKKILAREFCAHE